MCEGVDCSDKEHCSRHTANINEINQSWSHAFQDKKPREKCKHFIKNTNNVKPQILYHIGNTVHICIPDNWNDIQIINFTKQQSLHTKKIGQFKNKNLVCYIINLFTSL